MTELYQAHKQWASRPNDQRFLTLEALKNSVETRRLVSREIEQLPLHKLSVGADNSDLFLRMPSGMQMNFTNWSFGQLCRLTKSPAEYLKRLPAPLAALNLQTGLRSITDEGGQQAKVLFQNGDGFTARAFNGVGYGRIWDEQVVSALMNTIDLSRWSVPLKAYNGVNSLEATTLYASDRDVFIFLTDETRPIEVDGNVYYRGFFTWNSEVGSATFGISTFLFSQVCQNRIIWGARDVEELRIRHTALAPERFLAEAAPVLAAMAEASDRPIIAAIRKAKDTRVGNTAESAARWLVQRGFGKKEAGVAVMLAAQGGNTGADGNPTALWSLVNAGTYMAQSIQNSDRRVQSERQWSALLKQTGVRQDYMTQIGTLPEAELAALSSAN